MTCGPNGQIDKEVLQYLMFIMSIVVFFCITYMHTCATDQWTLTMEEDLEKMSKGNVLMELRKDFGKQPQLL